MKNIFIEQFLQKFEEKEQRKVLLNRDEQAIVERKHKKLEPIRQFLQQFVEQGVHVSHKDLYNKDILEKDVLKKEEKRFDFYDADSSESLAPGVSIWFDHPAEVEIAVPNHQPKNFKIKVASPHPKSHLLDQEYESVEAACQALAKFIFENTTSVHPNYKKVLKDYEKENNLAKTLLKTKNSTHLLDKNFFSRVPTSPPDVTQPVVSKEKSARTFGQYIHVQPANPPTETDTKEE